MANQERCDVEGNFCNRVLTSTQIVAASVWPETKLNPYFDLSPGNQFSFSQNVALPPRDDEMVFEDLAPYFVASIFNNHLEMGAYNQSNLLKKKTTAPELQNFSDQITQGGIPKIEISQMSP
jgi:hypothetical protein